MPRVTAAARLPPWARWMAASRSSAAGTAIPVQAACCGGRQRVVGLLGDRPCRGAAHGTGSGAGGVPARGDRPGRGFATRLPLTNVLPAANEHESAASDGIADEVVMLLGANEGQAGIVGTGPPGCLPCQTGASLPDGDSSAVVATRDIRRSGARLGPLDVSVGAAPERMICAISVGRQATGQLGGAGSAQNSLPRWRGAAGRLAAGWVWCQLVGPWPAAAAAGQAGWRVSRMTGISRSVFCWYVP
jgi:hypothetical protein